jgi:hypothetical protein
MRWPEVGVVKDHVRTGNWGSDLHQKFEILEGENCSALDRLKASTCNITGHSSLSLSFIYSISFLL